MAKRRHHGWSDEDEQWERAADRIRPQSPTPEQVSQGKAIIDQGQRLGWHRAERRWFCRTCGKQQDGDAVPIGWFSLGRHSGQRGTPVIRLGIYCSIPCLERQLPRIEGIGNQIGVDLLESPYLQRTPDKDDAA